MTQMPEPLEAAISAVHEVDQNAADEMTRAFLHGQWLHVGLAVGICKRNGRTHDAWCDARMTAYLHLAQCLPSLLAKDRHDLICGIVNSPGGQPQMGTARSQKVLDTILERMPAINAKVVTHLLDFAIRQRCDLGTLAARGVHRDRRLGTAQPEVPLFNAMVDAVLLEKRFKAARGRSSAIPAPEVAGL